MTTMHIMIIVTACTGAVVLAVVALVMALPGPEPTPIKTPAVIEVVPPRPTPHVGGRASLLSGGYTARHATPTPHIWATWRTAA